MSQKSSRYSVPHHPLPPWTPHGLVLSLPGSVLRGPHSLGGQGMLANSTPRLSRTTQIKSGGGGGGGQEAGGQAGIRAKDSKGPGGPPGPGRRAALFSEVTNEAKTGNGFPQQQKSPNSEPRVQVGPVGVHRPMPWSLGPAPTQLRVPAP